MRSDPYPSSSRRPTARLQALFQLFFVAFLGYRVWPEPAAAFGVASANAAAPDFRLTTFDGGVVAQNSLRGGVVLLNFRATWCPPCRVEMPGVQDVYDRKQAEGFTILGVSTDASGSAHVWRCLRDHRITYPDVGCRWMTNSDAPHADGGFGNAKHGTVVFAMP